MRFLKSKRASSVEFDPARWQALGAEVRREERADGQPACALTPTNLSGPEADAWLGGYTNEVRARG